MLHLTSSPARKGTNRSVGPQSSGSAVTRGIDSCIHTTPHHTTPHHTTPHHHVATSMPCHMPHVTRRDNGWMGGCAELSVCLSVCRDKSQNDAPVWSVVFSLGSAYQCSARGLREGNTTPHHTLSVSHIAFLWRMLAPRLSRQTISFFLRGRWRAQKPTLPTSCGCAFPQAAQEEQGIGTGTVKFAAIEGQKALKLIERIHEVESLGIELSRSVGREAAGVA